MARPRAKFDEELVKKLASIYCTNEEIALVCGVSKDTIERHTQHILRPARAEFKTNLRRAQYAAALKGDRTMLVWLGKQYLEQRDYARFEHTGADGGPIQADIRTQTASILSDPKALEMAATFYKLMRAKEASKKAGSNGHPTTNGKAKVGQVAKRGDR